MERDRVSRQRTHASAATIVVVLLVSAVANQESSAGQQATDQATQEFEQRLMEYLNLRRAVFERMPIAQTTSGRELAARAARLSGALRSARKGAKPGDLIPDSIAIRIQTIILEDFKQRSAVDERATFTEVPDTPRPIINNPYPASAALPTLPPLLLLRLPRLPEHLQYRFYGRHLVVLDGDTEIIVDYIANILPPRPR